MGIQLVTDELNANGNKPADYVLADPSSFKVVVYSADPLSVSSGANETHLDTNDETKDDTNLKLKPHERFGKLIELIHKNSHLTMDEMASEMDISRSTIYRLIKSSNGKIVYKGDKYHGEWTASEE